MRRSLSPALRGIVQGYRWRMITIGESGADTYRLTAPRRRPLILKHVRGCSSNDLMDEARRVAWLGRRAPAPKVVAAVSEGDRQWLVMTALPGTNACDSNLPPETKVTLIAKALSALHAARVEICPFDESLDRNIARAKENAAQGRVDESQFDERNMGRSSASLLRSLVRSRPSIQDLVVTHGDACLPNFMLDDGQFSGLVDCARVGVADRYRDLALACRSIEYDLGEEWVTPFLQAYGIGRPDRQRLAFYRLLDEFF